MSEHVDVPTSSYFSGVLYVLLGSCDRADQHEQPIRMCMVNSFNVTLLVVGSHPLSRAEGTNTVASLAYQVDLVSSGLLHDISRDSLVYESSFSYSSLTSSYTADTLNGLNQHSII